MGKRAKITIEYDGMKSVWETDSFNMQQSRDVKKYEFAGDPKSKFKPGDSTLVIVAFRPSLILEECVPVPTLEKAFGISTPDQAQAIQESRRAMISSVIAGAHVGDDFTIKEPVPSLRALPEHPEDHEARLVEAHWPTIFVYTRGNGWEPIDQHVERENNSSGVNVE